MKYLVIVGDGMADFPIAALGDKTPMSALSLPSFARVGAGRLGRLVSCPQGLPAGSDVAFLTLLGNDAAGVYNGRSPLEAAGLGIPLGAGETALRMNLATIEDAEPKDARMLSHNGGGIDGEDAHRLAFALMEYERFARDPQRIGLRITPTRSFRHVAVLSGDARAMEASAPHDIIGQPIRAHLPRNADGVADLVLRSFEALRDHPINKRRRAEGLLPANIAWFWGAGGAYSLQNFQSVYGVRGGVISAVPLVKGIARLMGLNAPDIPGATGLLDTDYQAKVDQALSALRRGDDFALVHIEAPDEMSHDGNLELKMEAIRRVGDRVVDPLFSALPSFGDFRMLLLSDHYTLLRTRTHDATPVPFALYDSRYTRGLRPFDEDACAGAECVASGDALMRLLFSDAY